MQYFQKIVWIQGLIDFSVSAYFILVTWQLYMATENAVYTGLFVGLGFLPSFLCIPFFGVFIDRYNKKYLLIGALLIMLATMLFVFSTIHYIHPAFLIVSQMLMQLCGSLIRPTIQAYVAKLFSREQYIVVFSKSASYTIIGGILGTSISSLLVSKSYMIGLAFIVLFPLFIIMYLLIRLPAEEKRIAQNYHPIFQEIAAGFSYCLSKRYFIQLLALLAIGQLIYHTTVGFLAAFTYEILNSSATIYGMLEITLSVGGILAGVLSAKLLKILKEKLPFLLTFLLTICLFQLAISKSILLAIISCFCIGYCTTFIRTTFQALQQMATDDKYHGRVASIRMFFNQGCVVCLTPIFGYLAQNTSIHIIFAVLTCFSLISIVICILLRKNKQYNAFS